jgi:hypothetical protein
MPSREYEKALFILKTSTGQKNQAGESKSTFFGAFEHSGANPKISPITGKLTNCYPNSPKSSSFGRKNCPNSYPKPLSKPRTCRAPIRLYENMKGS